MTNRNLDRRVERIEDRLPTGEPPCRTCGAPVVEPRWVVAVIGGRPLPECPECGRTLDYAGVPLAPGGMTVMCADDPRWEGVPGGPGVFPKPPTLEELEAEEADHRDDMP